MTREEAKEIFRNDKDSYGKPKAVMTKINKIYDDFENRTCATCGWYMNEVCCDGDCPLCAEFVSKDFGCNKFKEKLND